MDPPSNYDYRRQGEIHHTNLGYPLHAAEGYPHEESRAAEEERRVHRHPYLEERPERSATSVDLGCPNGEQYCELLSAV